LPFFCHSFAINKGKTSETFSGFSLKIQSVIKEEQGNLSNSD
jgi:hypothetical protein